MSKEFSNIVSKINAGNAILFTGAAFSKDSSNIKGENSLPLSEDLSLKICKLGNFSPSKQLSYSSDRYLRENKENKDKLVELVELLKNTFTIDIPSDDVKKICLAPWNKYYTTNYDNSIEKSTHGIVSVDTGSPLNNFEIKDKRCVHINGFIENLTIENLNKSFKLTESSYLSPDGFLSSPWYTVFKRDLERSSALVFVGYSLYDIDIKRILVAIEGLRERTYFIVKEDCTQEEEYTFSQYGTVLKIGTKGFSKLISNCTDFIDNTSGISCLHIKKYEHSNRLIDIHDIAIEKLLLLGTINEDMLENDILSKGNNYVIFRDKIEKVTSLIEDSNIIITSEFGNGKTIFVKETLPFLANKFKNIYVISDPYSDYLSDIERVCSCHGDEIIIFVIDDYVSFINIFEYLSAFQNKKIRFLLSSRSNKHENQKKVLANTNFTYKELAIDILSENEQNTISSLIDSIGFWGRQYPQKVDKHKLILKCRRQISLLLLSLLDSQHIKDKIKKIISSLIENDKNMKRATVTGLYLCMQDIKVDTSMLSDIAGDFIYDSKIINDENFKEIFNIKHGMFTSKSSIFCQKVIKDFIDPSYTISLLLSISERLKNIHNSTVHAELLKSCFKFSTIEKIIPNDNKLKNIINYYEKLKRIVPWLIHDPHFWLQYAMGYISCGKYERAQTLLNNAYGKAKTRPNYYIDNIDTQQARLYILKSMDPDSPLEPSESIELFKCGHKKLTTVPNSRYKYRQVYLYEKFYKYINLKIDKNLKQLILTYCNEMIGSITSDMQNSESSEGYMKNCSIAQLKNIINHIKNADNIGFHPSLDIAL